MSFNNTKTPTKPTTPAKWQVPMRRHPASGVKEYYLKGKLKERFCELFPYNTNRRMMEWFGISHFTLQRFKHELGLKKDMQAIYKQHSEDIKEICENNGYYASMRGKPVPEACMEATRRLRAEGYHPFKRLKEINPEKYEQMRHKMSEQRKELWRKERLRQSYGLPRKTKFHIPDCNISPGASKQKYLLIHKFNYFADPFCDPHVVCYDSETRRAPRHETTAVKHGLKVVEADE